MKVKFVFALIVGLAQFGFAQVVEEEPPSYLFQFFAYDEIEIYANRHRVSGDQILLMVAATELPAGERATSARRGAASSGKGAIPAGKRAVFLVKNVAFFC